MEKAENAGKGGCSQRDSTEWKRYAKVQRADRLGREETAGGSLKLLEAVLYRDNLNNALKRVRANKGAPGVDGMTVEKALPWRKKLRKEIRSGKYKPTPVRRKEIPKADGGVRKLGIPTVKDRMVQQAIAQQRKPLYEPKFSEGSYGYRPGRSAQDAIFKIRGYAEEGNEWAVLLDLSKYFDMENGVKMATEEGSPQGGPLSPLLANIYLNELDWEYEIKAQGESIEKPYRKSERKEEVQVAGLCVQQGQGGAVHSCPSQVIGESEE